MKNFFLAFLLWCALLATTLTFSQTESCNLAVIYSPIEKFGIGAEFEFDSVIYVRPTIFVSDNYTKIFSAIGIPIVLGWEEKVLLYAGTRLGVINRSKTNGFAGAEIGINYRISDGVIIGIREYLDHNSDYKFYNEKSSELKTVLKIGIRL